MGDVRKATHKNRVVSLFFNTLFYASYELAEKCWVFRTRNHTFGKVLNLMEELLKELLGKGRDVRKKKKK